MTGSVARRGLCLALVAFVSLTPHAESATLTWGTSGTGGSGTWSDATIWNGATWNNATPDDAVFTGTPGTVTLTTSATARSLTFDAYTGTYTIAIGGQTLAIGSNGITMNAGAGSATLSGAGTVLLTSTQSWTNNSTTGLLTVSSNVTNGGNPLTVTGSGNTTISGTVAGTGGLTQSGAGTLTLSAANTFTGAIAFNSGTVSVASLAAKATSQPLGTGNWSFGGGTLFYNAGAAGYLFDAGRAITLTGGTSTIAINSTAGGEGAGFGNSGGISGTGTLIVDAGAGTNKSARFIPYTGSNTFAGTLRIQSGIMQIDATGIGSSTNSVIIDSGAVLRAAKASASNDTVDMGSLTGAGTLAGGNGGYTATFRIGNGNATSTFNGIIANNAGSNVGIAALTKVGSGTLTLTGANTYTGATTVSDGVLQVGSGNATGSIANASPVSVSSGGALAFNRSDALTYGGTVSGAGGLTKLGSGTLALSAANAYTGATTVSTGVLQVGSGGTAGSIADTSPVSVSSGAAIAFNRSDTLTYGGTVSGAGGLTKLGAGTLTLSASNSYTGATTVSAGSLVAANPYSLGSPSGNVVAQGGVLALGGFNFTRTGTVQFAGGTVESGTISNDTVAYDAQAGSVSAALAGAAGLVKTTTGTLTLSASNAYAGGTQLNAGVLALGNAVALGSSGTISFGGGTLQFSASNTTDYSSRFSVAANQAYRIDTNGQNVSLATALTSSGGSLAKLGSGTLALSANNSFAGTTTISAGVLQVGSGGAAGSIADASPVSVSSGATLAFNRSDALTYGGTVSGAGGLTKLGSGTLTLSAASTYTGMTTVSAGVLQVGSGGGTGSIESPVSVSSGAALAFNRSDALTYGGTVSGAGGLTKLGSGTLTLTAASTYTGPTTIGGGILQLGNVSAISAPLAYSFNTGTAANGGTQSVTTTSVNAPAYSATGGPRPGLGYVTLNGTNQYIEINPTSGNLPNLGGTSGNSYTIGMWIQTTTQGGEYLYKGGDTWTTGALSFFLTSGTGNSTGGTGTRVGGVQAGGGWVGGTSNVANGNWNFITIVRSGGTSTFYVNGVFDGTATSMNSAESATQRIRIGYTNNTGDGARWFNGSISGVSVYGQALTATQVGDLMAAGVAGAATGSIGSLAATTGVNITASGAGLDLNGLSQTIGSLAGVSGAVVTLGSGTLSINPASGSTDFAGVISGAGGLVKSGGGTQVISGSNSYTGATTVSAGVLQIGSGSATGSIANASPVSVSSGAAIAFNRSDALTYGGTVSGAGGLTKLGSGTLTLTAASTYTGPTTIGGGILQLGNVSAISAPLAYSFNTGTATNGGTQSVTTTSANGPTYSATGGPRAGLGYVTLNGTNQYIEINPTSGNLPNLSGTSGNSYTIGMWIQTTTPGGEYLYKGGDTWTTGGLSFFLTSLTGTAGSGSWKGSKIGGVQFGGGFVGGTSNVADGKWNFITIVRSGGTSTFYVNGVADGTATLMNAAESSIQKIRIGYTNNTGDGAAFFNGSISGVSVYGQALTAAQVQNLMTAGVAGASAVGGLAAATDVNITAGGAGLDLNGVSQTIGSLTGVSGAVVTLGSGTLSINPASGSTDFAGGISGAGGLVKSGGGTQVLSGSNSYTGATTVSAGVLSITGASALAGTSGVTIAGGAGLTYTGGADTFAKNVTVTPGSGTGTIRNAGGGLLTLSGTLSKDNSVLRLSGGAFNVTGLITGATPGTSDLVVAGTSSVTLSNTNTYNGPTFVIESSTLSLGINNAIPNSSVVTLGDASSAGTLQLAGFTDSIGGLAFGAGGGTLRVSATSTTDAPLTAATGTMTLTGGTLDLAGSGSTAGLYRVLAAQSIAGSFTSVTGTSAAYQLLTTSTSVDYQQKAVLGAVTVTNPAASIITGGSAAFTYTAANTALSGGATLSYTGAGLSNVSGSSGGSAAAGTTSGATAGLFFTGTTVGSGQTGTFTVNAPSAYGSTTATGTVTVNVLDHATSSLGGSLLTSTTISLGTWNYSSQTWESGTNSALFSIYNIASSYGPGLTADLSLLGVTGTANGFSTNLGGYADIAGGTSGAYSIFFNPAGFNSSGAQSTTFALSMSDKTGMAGATASNTLYVTANVVIVPEPGGLGLAGIGAVAAAWAATRNRRRAS